MRTYNLGSFPKPKEEGLFVLVVVRGGVVLRSHVELLLTQRLLPLDGALDLSLEVHGILMRHKRHLDVLMRVRFQLTDLRVQNNLVPTRK